MIEQHHVPRQTLVTLFQRAALAMVQELVSRVAAAGYADIRASDSKVFENLDPEGTRLTKLAERSHMTHQSMGELVDRLEKGGYLERLPDPADGRARIICFTSRGRTLMHLALSELSKIEATWLDSIENSPSCDVRAALERTLNEHNSPSNSPLPLGKVRTKHGLE